MKKPDTSGLGRPRLEGEALKGRSLRMTDAQFEELARLGGGAWLRKKLDESRKRRSVK